MIPHHAAAGTAPPQAGGAARARPADGPVRDRADLQEWLDAEVYPALHARLDRAFPEFGFARRGADWVATAWPDRLTLEATDRRPDRLWCYADTPWFLKLHGRAGLRWLDYVGGKGLRGEAFKEAVARLCHLAGVPCRAAGDGPGQEEAAARERRRDLLERVVELSEAELWLARGQAAREYLHRRGLADGDIRAFRLGVLPEGPGELHLRLAAAGSLDEGDMRLLGALGPLEGYVLIPWHDELGRPLTLYGRWPGEPPERRSQAAWRRKRDRALEDWQTKGPESAGPWDEPRLPKTYALKGQGSKCVPFLLDRALRAGHGEVVVVEGVLDALVAHAEGDTRVVASVGGRLGREQADALARRGVRAAFVVGDPDGGGDAGTEANVRALAARGVAPYVPGRLPEGTDPDELILKEGVEAWKGLVAGAGHGYRLLARRAAEAHAAERGPCAAPPADWWVDALAGRLADGARGLPASGELDRYYYGEAERAAGLPQGALAGRAPQAPQGQAKEKGKVLPAPAAPEGGGWAWRPLDSGAFFAGAARPEWLVERLLVAGQPCVVGGPPKALKTSLALDLCVSVASGTPFLGHFRCPSPRAVSVISGESGAWALQEAARRVCAGRGLRPGGLPVLWQTDMPQLADPSHLAALAAGLRESGAGLVIIDPLYLCLLAGQREAQASNLYQTGPLLRAAAAACLGAGATPVLVHHANRPGGAKREPLELTDLAFSGVAEFARQWLLVSRREAFEPGRPQRLWLAAGGSCGQAGQWGVDVEEGELGADLAGRSWSATVRPGCAVREEAGGEARRRREEAKEAADSASAARLLDALDALDPDGKGAGLKQARTHAALSGEAANRAAARLVREGVVEKVEVEVTVGCGARRRVRGLKRRGLSG